ncbi:MAG: hypothetical protein AAB019_06650, partial [Planctomycetota bacterium]
MLGRLIPIISGWKLLMAVLVVVCLGASTLVAIAMNCHSDSGEKEGQDHSKHQTGDKVSETNTDETPESFLKKADELLKTAEQAKDKDAKVSVQLSLIEHCSKMSAAAIGLLNECAELLQADNQDTARLTEKTKQAMSLLKKCVVLTDKCH